MSNGSLVVAGAGIRTPAQVTAETTSHIVNADVVFALVADPLAEYWLRSLNSATESLAHLYAVGKPRLQSYAEMVERMVGAVVDGARVCAVAYGHPGIAAYPLHESVRQVRRAGLPAQMLAGISAADCLYADLGIDPIAIGCVNFEATDFLLRGRRIDTSIGLILWQIGVIGESSVRAQRGAWNLDGLAALGDKLMAAYSADHRVTVYEAARYSALGPGVHSVALQHLAEAPVSAVSTLFVPPASAVDVDRAMAKRLGLDAQAFARRGAIRPREASGQTA